MISVRNLSIFFASKKGSCYVLSQFVKVLSNNRTLEKLEGDKKMESNIQRQKNQRVEETWPEKMELSVSAV